MEKVFLKQWTLQKKKGYLFVGIIGENEKKSGKITIKNLKTGKQETVKLKAEKVKDFLGK